MRAALLVVVVLASHIGGCGPPIERLDGTLSDCGTLDELGNEYEGGTALIFVDRSAEPVTAFVGRRRPEGEESFRFDPTSSIEESDAALVMKGSRNEGSGENAAEVSFTIDMTRDADGALEGRWRIVRTPAIDGNERPQLDCAVTFAP